MLAKKRVTLGLWMFFGDKHDQRIKGASDNDADPNAVYNRSNDFHNFLKVCQFHKVSVSPLPELDEYKEAMLLISSVTLILETGKKLDKSHTFIPILDPFSSPDYF